MKQYEALVYFDQSEMEYYLNGNSIPMNAKSRDEFVSVKKTVRNYLTFALILGSLGILNLLGKNYFKEIFNFNDLIG